MQNKIDKTAQIALEIRRLIDLPDAINVDTRFNPGQMILQRHPIYVFDIMLKFKKIDVVIEIDLSNEIWEHSDCVKIAKIAMDKKSIVYHSVINAKNKIQFKSESFPIELIKYFGNLYENTKKTTQ